MSAQNPSESARQHRRQAPESVGCAVLTVSDTRTLDTDTSGQTIVDLLESEGHCVVERALLPDEPVQIGPWVQHAVASSEVDVILITGGTGITPRDQTPETLSAMFTRELPGYGELLRMLSYEEIGAAAMLSRAAGGMIDSTVVLTMPGSRGAVRLAMEKLILPELGHLVAMARQK